MNANKLADKLQDCYEKDVVIDSAATMLRQQQAEIEALSKENEELSHLCFEFGVLARKEK